MRSAFLVLSVCVSLPEAFESSGTCTDADGNSLLQARKLVRAGKVTLLESMRDVAKSLTEDSDVTKTPEEVNAALATANTALQTMFPLLAEQHEHAQSEIRHGAAAVQACDNRHDNERTLLNGEVSEHFSRKVQCEETLDQAVENEQTLCTAAENCLCDEARTAVEDQNTLCAERSARYETVFCERQMVCNLHHQCHHDELEVYEALRGDVEAAMVARQQEYATYMQVSCLTDLITTAMLTGQPIDHARLTACDDVTTAALVIDFPELPAAPPACPVQRGEPACNVFPMPCIIRNAHSGRRLFAQRGRDYYDGVGAGQENGQGPIFADQQWIIEGVGDGTYSITNAFSDRRMFAQHENHQHATVNSGYDGVGAGNGNLWDDQKWYIEATDDGKYTVTNYNSGRRLFAQSGHTGYDGVGASMPIRHEEHTLHADQKWFIEALPEPTHTGYGQPCTETTAQIDAVQVCTVASDDGNTNPWVLFGDINHQISNFGESQVVSSPTTSGQHRGDSVQVGTFSTGGIGSPGYSLDIGQFCSGGSCNAPFDLMIQYGDSDVFSHSENGYSTTSGGFINNGHTAEGVVIGEHGLWGSREDHPNGYYATFCAYNGGCAGHRNDFWAFSTHGVYPNAASSVVCGMYYGGGQTPWKACPGGDNGHRMRYYIRSADLAVTFFQ